MKPYLLSLILLAGCANTPEKVVEVKVPVPVVIPCKADIPKPSLCVPKEGRVEWLRCELANTERNQAYIRELEAALSICSE